MTITLIGMIDGIDREVVLPNTPEVYIGRDWNDKDIADGFPLPHFLVSRRHCVIIDIGNNKYRVKDLGSTNGTYVNGIMVEEENIFNGDTLGIAKEFRFDVRIK